MDSDTPNHDTPRRQRRYLLIQSDPSQDSRMIEMIPRLHNMAGLRQVALRKARRAVIRSPAACALKPSDRR